MLVAAAAMAFTSCQKEETAAPETVSATLTMHAGVEETKTYLDENNAVLWGKGEAVTLYVGAGETAKFFDSASTDADGEKSASFTFEIDGVTAADSYALGGIYPASAAMDDNKNAAQYKVILPATQNQVDGNYDPSAYIMVLKPEMVDALPTEYTASFRRATALNKVTLTNVAEDITSVEITVPAEKYLAGRRYFDLTTGDSGEVYYDKSSTISVNSAFTGNSIDVWFCSWGVELAAGEELTITMKSATKSYTRTITANENGIRFVEGDLNTLKINMASATVEDTGDFSGEWLITGVKDEQVYAASAYVSGNNLKSVAISIEDGQILEVDGIANCMMTLTKIADGDYAGMYTITDVNGKYLYAASSSGNQLKGATEVSVNAYWTVELQENGTYSIVASESSNRNVMQFNGSDATNVLFNCYSSASQSPVTLYPYSMVKADTTPRITVEDTEYNVSADDETLEFSYTTKNIVGTPTVSVADGATMTNVEADAEAAAEAAAEAEAGIVTVIFDANAEEVEKTATLVLSYEGAESVYVTITQAAKAAEGAAYYEKVTSAPADWSGNYLIVFGSSAHATNTNNKDLIATTSVSITDNKIAATDALAGAVMTVTKSGDNYHMTYPDGKYFGMAKNASTAVTSAFDLTFIYTDSGVKISGVVDGTTYILYSNSGNYFRCYTDKTGTSGYTLPTLYKLSGNSEGEGGETPEPELQERNLAFSSNTATATVGEDFTEPTLSGATTGVTYSSSNTSVATVNESTGAVTLVAAGETTITATAAADATYKAGEASYTLTVSAGSQGGETSKTWKLVTDASTLTAGDKLAIVSSSKGKVAGSLTSQYLTPIAVAITGNAFSTLPSGAVEFTLGGASGAWTLAGSDGILLGATAVKKLAWGSGTTTWSISIDDNGDATIQNGTSSYGRFLYNNTSPRFTTYTSDANSSMLLPQIYRYE